MRHRKPLPLFALLLALTLLCWSPQSSGHDAVYPHHREDFEDIARRRDTRTIALLSTAIFVCALGVVITIAYRQSRESESESESPPTKQAQTRAAGAAESAAAAAKQVIDDGGNVADAADTALRTYAEASGTIWRPRGSGRGTRPAATVPYRIRCRIGTDRVHLSITATSLRFAAEPNVYNTGGGSQGPAEPIKVVLQIEDR